MVKIREAIVVEGRYDKNTLSQIVDAPIFETSGFGIFKNPENLELLRLVAKERKLIIFTDSDGAGFVIRNHLKSAIAPECLLHAYIPDVYGKEKRKKSPGKEGKIGVEGMPPDVILECLRRAGATIEGESQDSARGGITKLDLFYFGLYGNPDSSIKRKKLLQLLGLPEHMSTNGMLQVLNILYTKDQIYRIADTL